MLIGIDVGTTGTKTLVVDEKGKILQYSYKSYPSYYPKQNHVEQSINDILHAVVQTVQECVERLDRPGDVEALSLSVQSGTLVPLDPKGQPFGRAISWQDSRCGDQYDALVNTYGDAYFYNKTGWKISASYSFVQIYRMKQYVDPAVMKTLKFLSVSDCVMKLLVGEYYTDVNSAGNLQLMNFAKQDWDEDLMFIGGYRRDQLGTLVPSGEFVGCLLPETAKLMGLGEHVRVFSGAQDQYCSAIGMNVNSPGDAMLSTGTSWVLVTVSNGHAFDEQHYPTVVKHVVGDYDTNFVYTAAGGSALKWLRNNILFEKEKAEDIDYSVIDAMATQAPVGSDDLFFLPHLAGALYPAWESRLKGMFYGLDFIHERKHLARSVMEGVVYDYRRMIESLRTQGVTIKNLKALGGATRSDFWMSMVSDITGLSLVASNVADIAPIGAAMIAAVGNGIYSDYQSAYKGFGLHNSVRKFSPGVTSGEYNDLYRQYDRLCDLNQTFYTQT